MKPIKKSIKLLKILSFCLSTAFLVSNMAAAKALDPLNAAEISDALTLSTSTLRQRRSQQRQNATIAEPEVLLVERRAADKDNLRQRLADIYRYDYQNDETVHTVIDLNAQSIISSERHQFLQLPLTANEIDRATQIVFADQEQLALLNTEYQRITGQYLEYPTQLRIKAFSFSADSLPEQLNPASQQCGLNRCAQLLLYTHEAIVFEVSPIVNLSAGIVTQNIGY